MVTIVKLDGKNNFLYDKDRDCIVDRYNPYGNQELILKLEDSTLNVKPHMIKIDQGKQIVVQHNDNRYIIDDGYQNVLVKAGYIVFANYDQTNEYNKEIGEKLRRNLIEQCREAVDKMAKECLNEFKYDIVCSNNQTSLIIETERFIHTAYIDTVSNLVTKNHWRMDNGLPYYPFDKNMDKYGTLYLSIFAQKKYGSDESKYQMANNVVSHLISKMGTDFHFNGLTVGRRVIR